MAGSFVENVNLLASKIDVVEEANSLFDEGVIPILEEIALLDLDEAIQDLKKGNYLGNRKIDINLALNIQGITQELIDKEPDQAEAIWTNTSNTVLYNKATATFVDGTVIELPFLFDGNPVTVSTHGDLLAQLSRLDYVYAQAQVDSLYQITAGDNTDYIITIDNDDYTYTSGVGATRESIIAGIANMINAEAIPITANVTDLGTKLTLTANVAGNPFYAEVSPNMAITTITPNVIEGPRETEFLAKLTGTLAANFASPVVGELVKIYDIIGQNSNLERLQLHAISGKYIEEAPLYYWAKTTSAFQTLSMRANDIIKLGNEIDKIIKLASSIDEVIEIQNLLPQLVDTFDANGNPNGDQTIYNALTELKELHSKLTEIITVYNDMKVGGNNYIQSVGNDLQTANTIGVVAEDLNLGVDSTVKNVGNNITSVVTVSGSIDKVIATADNEANINLVASEIVPHLPEILLADNNAIVATNKALEATNAAAIATAKNNEIKNVSVGTTITGAAGTNASVVYNPANGKFTFVVPQGIKGDRGDAFQVNSIGTLTQRALYDNQLTGFSFLAVDVVVDGSMIPHIYFKLSSSSGNWSVGIPFGRGDKGDTGNAGNGITQVVFTGTSHASGLAGQSGGTDTYTISYTDSSTDTFVVYNGLDAGDASKIVFEPEGDITATNVQLAIQEVRDDTDTKLALKQDTLVSGISIKTLNGKSILGSGDIDLEVGLSAPEVVLASTINERSTVVGTLSNYSSAAVYYVSSEKGLINGLPGLQVINTSSFSYTAPDIISGTDDVDTIIVYYRIESNTSHSTVVNTVIAYVPLVADDTIQVVDFTNEASVKDGFDIL